ncbi:MAG: helix-turn-helix transcriptional regulator [Pseudobdellovibrionaceae bacterium]
MIIEKETLRTRNPRRSSVDGDAPNPVDVFVGQRLRARRNLIGITQENLAEAAGITFQQVQKYEKGRNRLSASRLFQFARVLDVPVAFFFEGFAAPDSHIGLQGGFSDNDQAPYCSSEEESDDIMVRKETVDLIKSYYAIPDEKLRRDFLKMIKQMSKNFRATDE